jgi:hypothetical protein
VRRVALLLASCAVDTSIPCTPRAPDATDDDVLGFYACVDASLADGEGCGADGYLLGFGGRYGQLYVDGAPEHLTPAGQAWVGRAAACLQAALLDAIDRTTPCDAVWTAGFATHEACYVSTGFCALPLADQLWIFSRISDADRARPEIAAMVQAVADDCAARTGGDP